MSVTHRRTNELMDWMEHIMIAIFIVLDRSSTFIVLDRGSREERLQYSSLSL